METSLKYSQAGEREHEQQRGFLTLLYTFFCNQIEIYEQNIVCENKNQLAAPVRLRRRWASISAQNDFFL
jgi:hypothetical protein